MIQQSAIGLNSRSEGNPFNQDGFLPLITAPMYSVVDEHNYQVFLDNKIQVCLPRSNKFKKRNVGCFEALSLDEFKQYYCDKHITINEVHRVCCDTANGNIPALHDAIRQAKEIHGDKLVIMAGNVASVEAFVDLAKTGCDYIRVGIGGGCLAANTRILMANGTYKNIIDIQVGDYVINKDGKPVKVINTLYSGKKKVSKIKHNAFYNPLIITNDHQVRVSDLSPYKRDSISSKGYKAFFKKDVWKPISESIKDNLLCPTKISYDLPIDFNISLNQFDSDKSKNVIGNIKPSYELGYIFGTFLGDGNINIREDFYVKRNSINKTGSVHWAFGKNEDSIALSLIEYIESVFRKESGFKKEENRIRVSLYCKWIANLFSEFYKEDGTKYLPVKWYCLNDDYLKGLYDGLIDSDGHKETTRDCFENTSPYLIELIYFIKSILQGYFPNTEQRKKTCGKLENCNENNLKQSYSLRTLSNYLARQTEKFNLLKVTLFEKNVDEIDTYDIEVDCPTHSFIANNCIVHNSGCNTTSNTGVGQTNLLELVKRCDEYRYREKQVQKGCNEEGLSKYLTRHGVHSYNISNVKIVADGISSWINYCQKEYGYNDNGYAAINELLFAQADLVMVGKLFAQCIESAGDKRLNDSKHIYNWTGEDYQENLEVKYSGMSTQEEQKKYKQPIRESQFGFLDLGKNPPEYEPVGEPYKYWGNKIKPSEGSIQWIPVRWSLDEWLSGSTNQDEYPYLMGWINSIKSAMSYAGKTKL